MVSLYFIGVFGPCYAPAHSVFSYAFLCWCLRFHQGPPCEWFCVKYSWYVPVVNRDIDLNIVWFILLFLFFVRPALLIFLLSLHIIKVFVYGNGKWQNVW